MATPAERLDAPGGAGLDAIGRDAEHVLRYRAEIERRFAGEGVGSIGDLAQTVARLRRALATVNAAELAWTRAHVDDVIGRVEAYAAELATLRQLKRRVGG